MRLPHFALVSTLALAGCGGTDSPGTDAGTQTRAERIAAMTGSVSAGKLTYDNQCAGCHGSTGLGGTVGPALQEPLKNDPATEIIDVLLDGKGATMPSYASLEDQALSDLYAYLKSEFGK